MAKGIADYMKQLKKFNLEKDGILEKSLDNVVARIEGSVIKLTPVDTSLLSKSWVVTKAKKEEDGVIKATIFNNVKYASDVEYGHLTTNGKTFVAGRFMLKSSLEGKDEVLRKTITKAIKDAIKPKG